MIIEIEIHNFIIISLYIKGLKFNLVLNFLTPDDKFKTLTKIIFYIVL
jgi:hypothetical protein